MDADAACVSARHTIRSQKPAKYMLNTLTYTTGRSGLFRVPTLEALPMSIPTSNQVFQGDAEL